MHHVKMLCSTLLIAIALSSSPLGIATAASAGAHKVFRFNNDAEPQTLDPALMLGVVEGRIAQQIFEGLVTSHPKDLSPQPAVAKSWSVSNDGRTYTFKLRDDAKWSDGTLVDAETFHYSWLRTLAPQTAAVNAYMLWPIRSAKQYSEGKASADEVGIKVIDRTTLQVTLESPIPYFLDLLANDNYLPVPAHVVQKHGDKWTLPENIVTNGPFTLQEWIPKDHITLARNEHYWDKSKVKLDRIVIFPHEDENTAVEMFQNNEVDWVPTLPSQRLAALQQSPHFHVSPFLGTYYFIVNVSKHPALGDARVRKALHLAIERESITKYVLKGGELTAYSFVPPMIPGYQAAAAEHEDIAKARQLLAEAGYAQGKGFPVFTLTYNTNRGHRQIAEAVQQMWKRNLGINVNILNQEWKVYLDNKHKHNFELTRCAWVGDYLDPNSFLDMWVTHGENNNSQWSNPKYDALIRDAARETDGHKRMQLLQEAERILMDELPIIPVFHYTKAFLLHANVQGFYANARDRHSLKEVSFPNDGEGKLQ